MRRFSPVDVAVVVLLATIGVGLHMARYPRLSAFDEPTHIDYALSLSRFDEPVLGKPYDQITLREWACRGHHEPDAALPDCEAPTFNHSDFAGRGVQRNSTPPLYYGIAAAVAGPLSALTGMSFVAFARLAGILFLSIGSLGAVDAARRFGVTGVNGLTPAVVALGMPTVLHASATVNSDAAVFALGGVAAAVAARHLIGTAPGESAGTATAGLGLSAVLAIAAGLTKSTALFGIGVLGLVFLGSTLFAGRSRRHTVQGLGVMFLGAGSLAAWMAFVATRRPIDFVNPVGSGNGRPIDGRPFDEILSGADDLFPPTRLSWFPVPDVLQSSWQSPWSTVLGVTVVASVVLALLHKDANLRVWSGSTALGGIASGMIVQSGLALGSRELAFPQVNSRYGLALVPFALVLVVTVAAKYRALRFLPSLLAVGSVTGFALSVF